MEMLRRTPDLCSTRHELLEVLKGYTANDFEALTVPAKKIQGQPHQFLKSIFVEEEHRPYADDLLREGWLSDNV